MAMNREKFRNIVGGITTPDIRTEPAQPPPSEPAAPPVAPTPPPAEPEPEGEGRRVADSPVAPDPAASGEIRRFARRGRPKGSKPPGQSGSERKVKVSLFLSETIVNDLYEWAHLDRMQPGEMFEAALKPFHEREAKRRKSGKE